jgi:hypothetical protein
MRIAPVLLLLLSQIGCAALQPGAPVVHPSLFLDQAPLRGVILNATPPEYGLDGGRGCVPGAEFRIELTDLAIADDGRLRMTYTILNADPRRQGGPLFGVRTSRDRRVPSPVPGSSSLERRGMPALIPGRGVDAVGRTASRALHRPEAPLWMRYHE